jgi:hypothetical protein
MPFQIPRGGNTRFAFSYMQSLQGSTFISSAGSFSPNVLFAASEAGDWFDPSDLSRVYTDVNGATPVTADGQTVFSIFGQRQGAMTEVVGDPSFDDPAYWTNESTGGATAVVSGGQAVLTGNTGLAILSRPNLLTVGRVYEVVVTGTVSGQFYIHNLGNSALTLGVVYHLTARSTKLEFRVIGADTATITDISVKEYAFTELRQSDAAKRPAYKTSGGLHWLQFDGTNDALASAATLNLTGTDKVTVCAGVRKLSDVSAGLAIETSADINTNPGSFYVGAPESTGASGNYTFTARASAATPSPVSSGVVLAPNTSLLTALADISTSTRTFRRNGVQTATSTATLGTGNFGNRTLFVGARNQTSLYLNGDIYFLLIRGALTAGADLTALEGFAAARTGITL